MAVVVTRQLTKRFGKVQALAGLDLSVPAGSILGFLGPNGAGKTTALRILVGLLRATSGRSAIRWMIWAWPRRMVRGARRSWLTTLTYSSRRR